MSENDKGVVAVLDALAADIGFWHEAPLREVADTVRELIEADEEYDAALCNNIGTASEAGARLRAAVARRRAALAHAKGAQQT